MRFSTVTVKAIFATLFSENGKERWSWLGLDLDRGRGSVSFVEKGRNGWLAGSTALALSLSIRPHRCETTAQLLRPARNMTNARDAPRIMAPEGILKIIGGRFFWNR